MRYKIKNKIKYFFIRNLKRLIRSFVLFGLISLLTISSFAIDDYQYTYSQLVSNGFTDVFIYPVGGKEIFYQSTDSEDSNFVIESDYNFYGARFNINRSDFLNRSFKPGYLFFFDGTIMIDVNTGAVSDFANNCSININYIDDNGVSRSILFSSEYFEVFLQTDFEWGTRYHLKFNISNYTFVENGTITSLDFTFSSISSSTLWATFEFNTNDLVPDLGHKEYYNFYLGTKENAPTFLAPNNDAFNDFSSAEEDLLNNTNADDELNSIFGGFSTVIGDYANGFTILRDFLNPFLEWSPFLNILFISLALGIFGLIVNLGFSSMSASDRKSRNEYYTAKRDYYNSRKKR